MPSSGNDARYSRFLFWKSFAEALPNRIVRGEPVDVLIMVAWRIRTNEKQVLRWQTFAFPQGPLDARSFSRPTHPSGQ
jgi:hypothetical protein